MLRLKIIIIIIFWLLFAIMIPTKFIKAKVISNAYSAIITLIPMMYICYVFKKPINAFILKNTWIGSLVIISNLMMILCLIIFLCYDKNLD